MTENGPVVSLRPAGVTEFDELVYRAMFRSADGAAAGLAAEVGAEPERVEAALHRLRDLGLVNRLAGAGPRYAVVDPGVAVGALLQDRVRELEHTRAAIAELSGRFHAAQRHHHADETIEIVSGQEALGRAFTRIQQLAEQEILVLDRPPYALAAANPVEPVILARGVVYRGIYAPEALALPGALAEVRSHVAGGERARVLPGLPLKLAIADRRIAVLPLTLDMGDPQSVVIHDCTLLDALVDLFEAYWQQALPLDVVAPQPDGPEPGPAPAPLSDDDRALLMFLVAGLKDEAIARQLGLSVRTLRRRMQQLLTTLGADNRFQAGVQAVRRGWI
jgi:hypothetical protein